MELSSFSEVKNIYFYAVIFLAKKSLENRYILSFEPFWAIKK